MSKLSDKIGNFTTIPNSVIELWPVIGVDGMALFMYLRYRTNSETEVSFPSYKTICEETKLTRRRIALAIRALEAAGVLERKRRFSSSTIYILKLPLVQQVDCISPDAGLPLVQQVHTNKTDLNQTELTRNSANAQTYRERTLKALAGGEVENSSISDALKELCGRSYDKPTKTDVGYINDLKQWGATPKKLMHFAHYFQMHYKWKGKHPPLKDVRDMWDTAMAWQPANGPARVVETPAEANARILAERSQF